MEEVAAAGKTCAVQVFATDIDEEALKFARLGVYPESIVADVEADRLAKFFVRKDAGYQISDALRKSVVFAAQNLIADPPFSKMDVISCRNLLIYLDAETQTRLMPLVQLRVESRRVSVSGQIGGDRRPQRPVRYRVEEGPALSPPCAGPPDRPGFADFAGPQENDADRGGGRRSGRRRPPLRT